MSFCPYSSPNFPDQVLPDQWFTNPIQGRLCGQPHYPFAFIIGFYFYRFFSIKLDLRSIPLSVSEDPSLPFAAKAPMSSEVSHLSRECVGACQCSMPEPGSFCLDSLVCICLVHMDGGDVSRQWPHAQPALYMKVTCAHCQTWPGIVRRRWQVQALGHWRQLAEPNGAASAAASGAHPSRSRRPTFELISRISAPLVECSVSIIATTKPTRQCARQWPVVRVLSIAS